MANNNLISITYSNAKLRVLVEEYITQQRSDFTMQSVCSYVLYWAMEDGNATSNGLYENSLLNPVDCKRIDVILNKIVSEGRLAYESERYKKLIG